MDYVGRWNSLLVGATLFGLISTTTTSAAPVKLNGALPANGTIYRASFSPDGTSVLYHADQDTQGVVELYIVPAGGGTPLKLNGALQPGGQVYELDVDFTPDGSHVLYTAEQDTDDVVDLYRVPITGGQAQKLNGAHDLNVLPTDASLSPDGSMVTYSAREFVGFQELYIASTTGEGAMKLVSHNGGFLEFTENIFSPDGSHVLLISDLDTPEQSELYTVPVTGGTPVKLNVPVVPGTLLRLSDVRFTADGSHVLYRTIADGESGRDLFVVPVTGGPSVKLNGTLLPNGTVDTDFVISPDGNDVLYVTSQDVADQNDLYLAPISDGPSVKLSGPVFPGGDVIGDGYQFSPDGNFVVYSAEANHISTEELFIVPRTGGTPIQLNGPIVANGDVSDDDLRFSPDGSRVFYRADQEIDGVSEFYSVAPTGGTPVKLNGTLAPGGDVLSGAKVTPDSARIIYRADQQVDGVIEVFIVPSAGGEALKVNHQLSVGQSIESMQLSPDGDRILYNVLNEFGKVDIYSRVVKQRFVATSGSWNAGPWWEHGETPDEVMHIIIDSNSTVQGGPGTSVAMIDLGGGTGLSTMRLENDVVNVTDRFAIRNRGVLRGAGQVNADVVVEAGGQVRVDGSSQGLTIYGDTFVNHGRVEAIGTASSHAEIEFGGVVSNTASTGLITGSHSRIRFNAGLVNDGSLALSTGENHVFGDIVNNGRIVVTGGAEVTFYDDIVQNGVLTISKIGSTSSAAVFLGEVSGSGTMGGGGDVFLEGDLRPGNSPGTISFNNNIFLGAETNVEMELGGMMAGVERDKIVVNGDLTLNGSLTLKLIDAGSGSYLPDGGSALELISATGEIDGEFEDTNLMPRGGVTLDLDYGANAVTLLVSGVRGDYNYDGVVDGADYVVWRKLEGTTVAIADGNGDGFVNDDDLDVLGTKFGRVAVTASPGPGGGGSVPEPHALVSILFAFAASVARRRQAGSR
jgi:Tol biopolymer transport system component